MSESKCGWLKFIRRDSDFPNRDFAKVNIFIISSLFTVFVDSFKRCLFEIMASSFMVLLALRWEGQQREQAERIILCFSKSSVCASAGTVLRLFGLCPQIQQYLCDLVPKLNTGVFTPSGLMLVASSWPLWYFVLHKLQRKSSSVILFRKKIYLPPACTDNFWRLSKNAFARVLSAYHNIRSFSFSFFV